LPEYGHRVEAMALDGQGRLWASVGSAVVVFDGANWQGYDPPGFYGVSAITFDGKGRAWFAHYEGVSVFDGTSWTTYGSDDFGLGEHASMVTDLAVDAQDRVWIATASGVSVFDGSAWTPYDESQGLPDESIAAVEADAAGHVWLVHDKGLSAFDGERWEHHRLDFFLPEGSLAIDAEGRVWVTGWDEVKVFRGGEWTTYEGTEFCGHVQAIAVDSTGRAYVGTDQGVSIFDGEQWVHYRQATSGLVSDDVTVVVVSDSGPVSLPPLTEPRVGRVTGRVLRDGAPLEGAKVELCLSVGVFFSGSSPCAGQCFYASATTDAEGRFAFEDVPVGTCEYAIKWGDKWYVRGFLGSEGIVVREGETTVIEDYDLAEAEE